MTRSKKLIKRTLFTLAICWMGSPSLLAQPGGGAGGPGRLNPEEMVQREKENVLKKVENLTADQTMLLNGIYDEFGKTVSEAIDEVRKTRNFGEMRTKMLGLRDEKDLLIKDVLDEVQYAAYLEVVEAARQRRQRNRGNAGNADDQK